MHAEVLPAEHWPHAPVGWQAGVAPPHSPSAEQPRQARVVPSHTGVAPEHCAFEVQAAHVPVGV